MVYRKRDASFHATAGLMKKGGVLLTFGVAALITVGACWFIWVWTLAPMDRALKAANAMQAEFSAAMNLTPRITVDHAVVFAQTSTTLELVTATRDALAQHRFSETWLRSTKEFEIEARFTARAGFALRDPIVVNVPLGSKKTEISLPRAKILAMDMADFRILRDEDGLWNKLTAKDRERAIRSLQRTARKDFETADLLGAATAEAQRRISEVIQSAGSEAVFLLPEQEPKQ